MAVRFDILGIYDINATPKEAWGVWIDVSFVGGIDSHGHPVQRSVIAKYGPRVAYKKAAGTPVIDAMVTAIEASESPVWIPADATSPSVRLL